MIEKANRCWLAFVVVSVVHVNDVSKIHELESRSFEYLLHVSSICTILLAPDYVHRETVLGFTVMLQLKLVVLWRAQQIVT